MAVIFGAGMAISVAVHLVLRQKSIPAALRLDVGFGYQVVIALQIAVYRHLTPWAPGDGLREISPVALVILLFAALIPQKPVRTLLASLLSATMDPIGLAISIAHGNPAPPAWQMGVICVNPFIAAGMATVISRVVYGLARSVDDARQLGSYQLKEKLGSGGMGEVWRAQHRMLARPAAIKLIRPAALGEVGPLRRFEREAHATSELKDPHTIQLYDFGVAEDGTFYYVMELLDGLDLEKLVERDGPQPAERVVHVLRQACASLEEAHRRGLIHRDIKPANIYLCRYGIHVDFVKVLDFGLVKPRDTSVAQESAVTVTLEGTISGTPAFIAPETALGETEIDGRADIYALGCVGYWLLTGQLVFQANTAMKMVVEHARTIPTAPSERTEIVVPADLDRVILDCLEKDPARRPSTAAELSERLGAIALGRAWSTDRARGWWDVHVPEATLGSEVGSGGRSREGGGGPTLQVER
jgi:eukaryotic-like serine/threonine-protein kinase